MAGFDISKYREMFLEEAVELFESADNVLLEAENNGSLTDEEMGQLFRDVHTLKGSGASVELPLFAEFTHDVENMMDKLRNHQIVFIPEMAGTLIDAMDIMKEILELEVAEDITRETFDEMTSEMLVQIRAYINGENVSAQEEVVVEPEPIQENLSIEESSDNFEKQSVSSSSSTSYGIFEDDFNEEESLENDSFGFFSEDMKISNSHEYDYDNENFGFFDDAEEITPASTIKVDKVEEKPAQKTQQAEVKQQATPAQKAVVPAKAPAPASRPSSRNKEEKKAAVTNNIRVNLDKIDLLMNNVGDLVITNAMLKQFTSTIEDNKVQNSVYERLEQLERHIRDMQDSIMSIRMVPMESIYSKFPKVVRDISKKLSKKVDFKHFGDMLKLIKQ